MTSASEGNVHESRLRAQMRCEYVAIKFSVMFQLIPEVSRLQVPAVLLPFSSDFFFFPYGSVAQKHDTACLITS